MSFEVKNKRILITGGSGSWGNELTSQLLGLGARDIIIFSRGELAQVNMYRKFISNHKNIKYVIGDIRDRESLGRAMEGVDIVFHLAALKHVPVCEMNPREAVMTNIIGTQNICDLSIKNGVEKVIDVSTDKAVAPCNTYGMTKAVGEKIFIHANKLSDETSFICIRGGNAAGSNGSVIPLFISQVKNSNRITLTHNDMTRYFMTLSDAVSLILKASEVGLGGETFVTRMDSFYISDIAKVIAEHYGDSNTKIDTIGVRQGEKLHEVLVSSDEARDAFVIDDDYYAIIHSDQSKSYYDSIFDRFGLKEYSSSTLISDMDSARKMLLDGGFLK